MRRRRVRLGGATALVTGVHCCHAFGPAMAERGQGHVAIVSSGLGYTPRATEAAYVTTKAAVLALAQSLRAYWGPRGVGVSAVCPGIINTGIQSRTIVARQPVR